MNTFKYLIRFFLLAGAIILNFSCVKEEIDFNKLSTQARITPRFVVPIASGSLTLANAIKEKEDTLVFNDDGTIKLIFSKDSVFEFDVSEIVTIPDPSPESNTLQLGPLRIDDLNYSGNLSLGSIANNLDNATRDAIIALDGTTAVFPPIPTQNAGTYNMTSFTNITQVTVQSGTINISVTNNLPVPVSFDIGLKNNSDSSPVGGDFIFTNIAPGTTQTQTVDVSGVIITNTLDFDLKNLTSPGSTPGTVPVDLNDDLVIALSSTDILVSGGTAILPNQIFYSNTNFIDINPDPGIEITTVEIRSGEIDYTISSGFSEGVVFNFILPSARKNGDTLKYNIPLSGNGTETAILSLADVSVDLTTDALQPYNRFPFIISAGINSSGTMVSFSMSNSFSVDYQYQNIAFSYLEGYFGQQTHTFNQDTIDLGGLKDFFERITGSLTFTNPVVRFPYESSFGIPASIEVQATGTNSSGATQDLNAAVQNIDRMTDRFGSPASGAVVFDRTNSDIVPLLALRPVELVYSGQIQINPLGNISGRDNFVLGNSKIIGSMEMELPWMLQMQDLALRDTLENPLYMEPDSDFKLSEMEFFRMFFYAANGFPIKVDVLLIPYDRVNDVKRPGIVIPELIMAAPVDATGKVTGPAEATITIDLDKQQLIDLEESKDLIVRFRFNTTDGGSREVVFYTDYSLDFRLAVETEFEYDFDLGNNGGKK